MNELCFKHIDYCVSVASFAGHKSSIPHAAPIQIFVIGIGYRNFRRFGSVPIFFITGELNNVLIEFCRIANI